MAARGPCCAGADAGRLGWGVRGRAGPTPGPGELGRGPRAGYLGSCGRCIRRERAAAAAAAEAAAAEQVAHEAALAAAKEAEEKAAKAALINLKLKP